MSKVYIIQEQMIRDKVSGEMRPAFDLSPAAVYGELVFLLPPGQISLAGTPMISALRRGLAGFSSEDFLVATGDPVAIFAAGAVAAQSNGGVVNVLKWDRRTRQYIKVTLNL